MECFDARRKLSEYIDGMLSQVHASEVKDHLDHCPDCTEEYQALRRIITHMNQMEHVDEPAHFIEKVHHRLGNRFSLKRITRTLFVPLQIKLPLELAGAATIIMLAFYVSTTIDNLPFYEISLTVTSQEKSKGSGKGAPQKDVSPRGEKKGARSQSALKREQPKRMEASPQIQEVVNLLGGNVRKSLYQKDTNKLQSLYIEIPLQKYEALLNELEKMGEITRGLQAIEIKSKKVIKIHITITNN